VVNKQDFELLVGRLHDHHIKCEGNSCTSHPIFSVQKCNTVWGIDPDYNYDVENMYDSNEGKSYSTLLEYFQDMEDEDFDGKYVKILFDILSIDIEDEDDYQEFGHLETCWEVWKKYEEDYALELEEDIINNLTTYHGLELYKCYGKVYWEDVTYFLTREAAEEFRDTFGYRHGEMRVYVKSGWESDQYKGLIRALLDGNLVWKEES
jgi:uncharacterized short protein YbdD (DUF466 family)